MKIGRKKKELQIKETLDAGYDDVTNVANWYGAIEKLGLTKEYVKEQITAYVTEKGGKGQLNEYDQDWYEFIKSSL